MTSSSWTNGVITPEWRCSAPAPKMGASVKCRGMQTIRHGLYNSHSDVDAIWILVPHDLSIILEVTGRHP